MDAIIFWFPAYRLSALLRFFTAVVSLGTAIAVVTRLLPKLFALPTVSELEVEVEKRKKAEKRLQVAREIAKFGVFDYLVYLMMQLQLFKS
jgi:hypothetical protein